MGLSISGDAVGSCLDRPALVPTEVLFGQEVALNDPEVAVEPVGPFPTEVPRVADVPTDIAPDGNRLTTATWMPCGPMVSLSHPQHR